MEEKQQRLKCCSSPESDSVLFPTEDLSEWARRREAICIGPLEGEHDSMTSLS